MGLQAVPHIYLTPNRTKLPRPETYRTKTHFTSALSCARTKRYMPMGTRTTMPTSTTWHRKLGRRNESTSFDKT